MDALIDFLGLLIGIVALFALLRLFSISNDVKAIREHVCSTKENATALSSNQGETKTVEA
jgi:hypothetical protein